MRTHWMEPLDPGGEAEYPTAETVHVQALWQSNGGF